MLSVAEAKARVLALAKVTDVEEVSLTAASGRVLAQALLAHHDQPPFRTATMDGYAIFGAHGAVGERFDVIGAARAGEAYAGKLEAGQAVRIFTGAPVPSESARVIIQEDVTLDGTSITLCEKLESGANIRAIGADFRVGQGLSPRRMSPFDVALAAAMNHAKVPVRRKPVVAVIATGDELVAPGSALQADQIIASNSYGIAALVERAGGVARIMPIARDTADSLKAAFDLAAGADLVLTIGGASVGEHDLVKQVAGEMGLDLDFWKIAMRPGKPLLAGRLNGVPMIGLPGNPVSALVCAVLFVVPLVEAMLGLPVDEKALSEAVLNDDIGANGPRTHFMRARLTDEKIRAFGSQDSALLTILAEANALIVRPENDPARAAGERVSYFLL
ncbi:MAG: gephyrin-like molybdotransferase Glp [Deltaproteobacteria bacterium]